jgi:hypothetical protein
MEFGYGVRRLLTAALLLLHQPEALARGSPSLTLRVGALTAQPMTRSQHTSSSTEKSENEMKPPSCGNSSGLDHMLAAVLGVADQSLAAWIDDPVHQFERDLSDYYRTVIRNFGDIANAIAPLHGEPNGAVNLQRNFSVIAFAVRMRSGSRPS